MAQISRREFLRSAGFGGIAVVAIAVAPIGILDRLSNFFRPKAKPITNITITSAGSGYTSAPVVTYSGHSDELLIPQVELASNPTIKLSEIRQRRFYIVE